MIDTSGGEGLIAFKREPPAGVSACSVVYGIPFPLNKLNVSILGLCVVAENVNVLSLQEAF